LVGKLSVCFCALSLLLGVAVIAIVYTRLAGGLDKEIKRHAGIVALSLSEAAKRYGAPQGEIELRKVMDKYAASNSIAYIYFEDARGRMVAHRPQELPIWLHRDFPKSAERALNGVEVEYRGSPVYEIAARVGERDGGFIHLAVWRDEVQDETRRAVAPIAASILVLLSGLTVIFALAVWSLSRPFMKIVALASRISKGELDLEIDVADANEVGDLARSFERMRSSLHAVLTRLGNEEFPEQSKEQD
jgi:methyl-accepting chemotaxis protein